MSFKKYLVFKFSKARDDIRLLSADIRRPRSWWYISVGFFVFYFYKWLTSLSDFWLWMMTATFLLIFSITVWFDYRNSPWRRFHYERLVAAEKVRASRSALDRSHQQPEDHTSETVDSPDKQGEEKKDVE